VPRAEAPGARADALVDGAEATAVPRVSPTPRWPLFSRLLWRAHAARTRASLARPHDTPQAFAAGRRSLRILLAGSGPAAGWGVASHDLALPGGLARALASITGRGCVVDVLPHPSAGIARLSRMLDRAALDRYDAVILSAAVADAFRGARPARWGARTRTLLRRARGDGGRPVLWLGAQRIRSIPSYDTPSSAHIQRHADRLNEEARLACADEGAVFVALPEPAPLLSRGKHRSPAQYLIWARYIADSLAGALDASPCHLRSTPAHAAESRVDAIERLRLADRRDDPRLDRLVVTARRTLGTEIAMFTVLDAEKEWPLASVGASFQELPIEQSVCLHTIRSTDGLVVPDAENDRRFADSALVTGPAHLRFYAGYPVEAPDGTRIGALCVFGRSPRDPAESESELDVLRELALLAQRELWRFTTDPE
jgi:GAF domain-containing protein